MISEWLQSGEVVEVKRLTIDKATGKPTAQGEIWLKQAGVKKEDLEAKVVRGSSKTGSPHKRSWSPNPALRVERTLALLKVAAVIARTRL